MTDRDRLAADLAANPLTLIPDGVTPLSRRQTYRNDYLGLADRLIALGWTRLDEERLARALRDVCWYADTDQGRRNCAADIIEAYREDTDV